MIVPEKETLAVFVREGIWQGIAALCQEQYRKSIRALEGADASDAFRIKEIQRELKFWSKDIPSLQSAYEEYVAQLATTPK